MPAIYRRSTRAEGRGEVMTTGAATQQIGKGYFSKAKSFPALKQRQEGKRRSDFENGSDSNHPSPPPTTPHRTLPTAYPDIPNCVGSPSAPHFNTYLKNNIQNINFTFWTRQPKSSNVNLSWRLSDRSSPPCCFRWSRPAWAARRLLTGAVGSCQAFVDSQETCEASFPK